jgi:hypothetical protein
MDNGRSRGYIWLRCVDVFDSRVYIYNSNSMNHGAEGMEHLTPNLIYYLELIHNLLEVIWL